MLLQLLIALASIVSLPGALDHGVASWAQPSTGVSKSPSLRRATHRPNLPAHRAIPTEWHLEPLRSQGSVLRLMSTVGWCVRAPKPAVAAVRVREGRDAVVVTVFRTDPRNQSKYRVCAGLELGLTKTLRLSADLGDRVLYDGSISPPTRRWPRRG